MSSMDGQIVVCDQHTGDPIQLRIFGDEFYGRYETLDGYTVVYDTDRGSYCFALLAAGRFVSSGIPTHKPPPIGLRRHLKEDPEVRNAKFESRYNRLRPQEPESDSSATRTLGPDGGLLAGRKLFQGNVHGLTLLVDFDDIRTNVSRSAVEQMMNGDDYRAHGNYCSVKEYFQIVSTGKLTYTNTVVGPIQLSKRRSYYIDNLLVEEALDKAVANFGVNLSEFDSQGAGIVDAINILYAGPTQYADELWPHNSFITLHYGGVRTHYYQLAALGMENVDLRIGTICHENGHLLCRFPDMYDYGKRDGDHEKSQGIGRYCLMGSGNHLNWGRTPSPVCGYLRDLAGWTDSEIVLNGSGTHVATHGDYATLLKYRTDTPNEYFVIENRSRLGLDSHLPASGLAVYHCDTLGSNEWQEGTRNRHYQCALLQADGHLDLENNRNVGDQGDLFSNVSDVALAHDTMPSSREWDGTDSGLIVSEISSPGESMRFIVGRQQAADTARGETFPNLVIPDNDPDGVTSTIPIAALGAAKGIEVSVQIIHSWISDLVVILEGPDGTTVTLHNREGNDGDDIMQTWDSQAFGALQDFHGKTITGDWKLKIVDHASADVGRLISWSLKIPYEKGAQIAEGSATPNLPIPDNDSAGASSAIALNSPGHVNEIVVTVDIEHTFIGDLQVDLIAPSGQFVRLHNNEGGAKDNIKRSYDPESTPELRNMIDEPIQGTWTLRVQDTAWADTGTLRGWSIKVA